MNETQHSNADRIAIVGMAGRFPGARDVDQFWRNLCSGVESIRFFTDDELREAGVEEHLLHDPAYVKAGGALQDIELFDAELFEFSPREAEITDPQHRIFLECAWEALENAGHDARRFDGRIGVYAGAGPSSYLLHNLLRRPDVLERAGDVALFLGNNKDFVPTRVCYKLDLKGPGISVNTACSSSLVATQIACQALLDMQCDMALAGGVGIQVPQRTGYHYHTGGIGSPDGHCRAFDAKAAGTVNGNGAGIVVLKRLADALADGDFVHAVILGSAVNNDGSAKVGFTAPSVEGQAECIAEALALAGVEPGSIEYVEAHGTGTRLGDPIEIAALSQAFGNGEGSTRQHCAIGSVKTNIGHLDEAAGVAGLIKTVLAIREGKIPPSLHFQAPNAEIEFVGSRFFVNSELSTWPSKAEPRRAGVSSFGIGGTNAHLVLEEAPARVPSGPSRPWQLLAVSAKTSTALSAVASNLAQHLESNPDEPLADVCYTLQMGRSPLPYRRAIACRDRIDAVSGLRGIAACEAPPTSVTDQRPVAFLFPGQGVQAPGIGRELYDTEPVFREQMDLCAERLGSLLELDLRELLFSTSDGHSASDRVERLSQTAVAQPALFSFQYALAQLWMSWGIRPQAMLGHSLGEYVAATLAEVLTLDDALQLIAARGRLLQQLPPGGMLAIGLTETELRPLLGSRLDLAAVNSPAQSVASGPLEPIAELEKQLTDRGVFCRRLQTSHAFHSKMTQPAADEFEGIVRQLNLQPPQIPFLSNVSGNWISTAEATDPAYWTTHMQSTVRFSAGVQELLQREDLLMLDLGPGQTLSAIVNRHPGAERRCVSCSPGAQHAEEREGATLAAAVGQLWEAGAGFDWGRYVGSQSRQRLPLPTYPFERQRYWVGPPAADDAVAVAASKHPQSAKETKTSRPESCEYVKDWLQTPIWRLSESRAPGRFGEPESWLVFVDEVGLAASLSESLRADGHTIVEVRAGDRFERLEAESYVVRPAHPEDYLALCEGILAADQLPSRVLHAWNVTRREVNPDDVVERSILSLLHLTQAIGSQPEIAELQVDILSNGLHRVDETDATCAEKALLLGPVRVTPLEYPQVSCRSIDVQIDESDTDGHQRLIDPILAELGDRDAGDTIIALRADRRYTPTLARIPDEPIETRLRERGVYLITGGLGSMGLAIAEHLAAKVQARLVLVGRSSLGHDARRRTERVEEIERAGGEVLFVQADVTDSHQMREAVRQAGERFGPIHGVIHAAGIIGKGLIQKKTAVEVREVLAPKVTGTRVLQSVLDGMDLDFFVTCSSLASTHPIAGQVDYCAANAFLDVFAHEATGGAEQRISIDWGFWQELGIIEKSGMPQSEQQAIVEEIRSKGWSRAGVAAFDRIMQSDGVRQVLVSPDFADDHSAQPLRHPWFESCLVDEAGLNSYVAHFSPDRHWVLDEHRIAGKPTLPGTAYLEMAWAAFCFSEGDGPVELRDVYFLSPLVLEGGETRELRAVLKPHGDGYRFHVVSEAGAGRWQEHARGEVLRPVEILKSRAKAELLERYKGLEQVAAGAEDGFATRIAQYPPRWRNIQGFRFENDEGLASLQLANEFAHEAEDYGIHPALLDNATGFLSHQENLDGWLPFCYERIVVNGPLPSHVFSRAVRVDDDRPTMKRYEVELHDENGAILLRANGYTLRKVVDDSITRQQYEAPDAKADPENFCIGIDSPGHLQSLRFAAASRPAPEPGEVEIEVSAAGLNFIEVLYALGMLPKPPGMEVRFGLECAGRVARVGPGVKRFREGDEVFAMTSAALSRYAIAATEAVAAKPDGMSWRAAAGLPAAYVTAWYALITKADLQRGERVLIHSATGGVGMAAVNIARYLGAEVLATAGSDLKRDYLRKLGIQHVSDSRSLGFADDVMAQTGGEGVDVVLNSLGGEFIDRGLSVLRRHGRFVELGKRDIFRGTNVDLRHFEKLLSFMAVDVGPGLPDFESLWSAVAKRLQDNSLPELPLRAFPVSDLAEAMEFMAQAKHIGKVVLEIAGCAVSLTTRPPAPAAISLEEIVGPLQGSTQPISSQKSASQEADTRSLSSQAAGHERPDLETPYEAPRDESESKLADIWQELLGINQVGVEDNFFELHGDSLLAAQLVSRVQHVFQVALPISIVFDAATVAGQAERIRQLQQASAPPDALILAATEHEEGVIQ